MVNCTYSLNDLNFDSYAELLKYVDEIVEKGLLKIDKLSDIVYSKYPAMDKQVNLIDGLKATYTPKIESEFSIASVIDSEPYQANSILNFLDSPSCTIDGRPLVTPLNRENYIKEESKKIAQERAISEEEAAKIVEQTLDKWDNVKKDSLFLHTTYTSREVIENDSDFLTKFYKDAPDSLKSTKLLIELHHQLRERYYQQKSRFKDCTTKMNVNLTAKLKTTGQEIFGHIDQMFIGKDGTVHLYLYKTTSTPPNEWQSVKIEKYKYQLAFLKAMLAAEGVNVDNIELSVIPVQLTYNDDYSKVTDITVHHPKVYSSRESDNKYAMHKYDKDARYFIDVRPKFQPISDKFIERVDAVNHAIFPELNVKYQGIAKSARSWIMNAPDADSDGTEPLVIRYVGDVGHYYDVIINGVVHKIESKRGKNVNPDILNLVTKHLSELTDNLGYSTQRLKEAIQESYNKGRSTFAVRKGLANKANTLESALRKYMAVTRDKDGRIIDHEWELLDNLIDANVLIFRNKDNELDLVNLSTFDLNEKATFSKGDTVLGSYLRKSEYIDLESNYGNIEVIRALTLLNEIIPQLGEAKLGNVSVLSAVGNAPFITHNIGEFSKKYYYNILNVVGNENKELDIKNNFREAKFVSQLQALTKAYLEIVSPLSEADKDFYYKYGFKALETIEEQNDKAIQAEALRHIMKEIQENFDNFGNFKYFESTLLSDNKDGDIARLYDLVTQAYFSLTGDGVVRNTSYNNLEAWFVTPNTIANENIQFFVNGLQTTYDSIASEFDAIYEKDIRKHFQKFYEKIGYNAAQNMSIGNLAGQFSNLYDMETMTFKNPYDTSNNLTEPERDLLKTVLYQIAKVSDYKDFKFDFSNEAAIAKYIETHPWYLFVPLERASKATARSSAESIKARFKNGFKRLKEIDERFDEYVNGISAEERHIYNNDSDEFYTFSLRNPFEASMPINGRTYSQARAKRREMIKNYGTHYFETNLENILINYVVKAIQTEKLQRFMVVSKAFMLRMHLTGNMGGNSAIMNKEIKHIENYLKVNVFNASIMSKQEKSVISAIMPLKTFATNVLIGGNIVGFVRDMFQGLEENFIRTFTKLNTDIDAKSVSKAYAYVTKHATSNAMAVNLLGKLCSKYRLSNTDVGRIGERYKTGRNGILNYDNWLYGTMRSPDFINRMTLFVAKCMHDGVWDAYSIDKHNNLVYDWKKDKRFEVYANPASDKNSEQYKKQKALYLSKLREYYKEHPDIASANGADMTIDLPSPYSQREIMAIRAVGDNIYGAYDKSKKAMAESHSLGICFAMFTTWLNGIINNYCMKPQRNGISKLLEEQETDENGNLLWYTEDGSETTENTGVPVLKFVPPIVMGIFPSIGILASMCKEKGLKAAYDYMKANPIMKANMRKLLSDLLVSLLLLSLFKLALDPAYKDYKKEAKDNPVVQNLATEILYKGSSKSYDTFRGLYNVVDFVGNNSATPIYSVPAQLMRNAYSFITDGKDLGTIFTTNTGIGRSFKDTYKLYRSSQQ